MQQHLEAEHSWEPVVRDVARMCRKQESFPPKVSNSGENLVTGGDHR